MNVVSPFDGDIISYHKLPPRSEEGTDLYGILGIKKGADQDDIKKAYRKVCAP